MAWPTFFKAAAKSPAKTVFFAGLFFLTVTFVFSQEAEQTAAVQRASRFTFAVSVSAAYYPDPAHTTKSGTHLMGFSGPLDAAAFVVTPSFAYTVPCLAADNVLMKDNHLEIYGRIQVSPITVEPQVKITFAPLAFLELSVGSTTGTGWNLFDFSGMKEFNANKTKYDNLASFSHWYLYGFASATLQFDAAALWPGDWHHIVMFATYETGYQRMSGTNDVWRWQGNNAAMANGWKYRQTYFLGYKMPLALSVAGFMSVLSGHYRASDFAVSGIADSYDGDFMTIELIPVAQFSLGTAGKDTLTVICDIFGQRSFSDVWKSKDMEPTQKVNGREFYFDSIAVQWRHVF